MESNQYKYVGIEKYGSVDELKIMQKDIPQDSETHACFKIKATAINRAEVQQNYFKIIIKVLMRKGAYPNQQGFPLLGLEASGYYKDKNGQEKQGMALLKEGGYGQYSYVVRNHIMDIPQGISIVQAAGIPEVWLTAYQLLRLCADIQPGSNVMIYAGASGVGQAAIQLTKYIFKGHPIASCSSQDKMTICLQNGAELALNYKENNNQVEQIMEFTNNKGVQVVLDCIGAQNIGLTTQILGMDSKWVLYGLLGGAVSKDFPLGALLRKRIQVISTTLSSRTDEYKSELIESFQTQILPYFQNGLLKPNIDTILQHNWKSNDCEAFKNAHNKMEANQNSGKIVIEYQD